MATTNLEILAVCIEENHITEKINTYAGWKSNGYQVQKGQKALFQTKIWKPCMVKDKKTGKKHKELLLVNASYFGISQVKAIEK